MSTSTTSLIEETWERSIVPCLEAYIEIPNKSPAYDPDWAANGHMARATQLLADWCREQPIAGMEIEVVQLEGRTPLILCEIPAFGDGGDAGDDCVLLYGHLDKQPEMVGWEEGLGPWIPVRRDDKLYGRGGADDGYAVFASLTAIRAVQERGGSHGRLVVLIEGCEESGSYDLPHYLEALSGRIGEVGLVICLDSGCGNYDQLWSTTSLRGTVIGKLRVDILREGVHSGNAGGVVPSSFAIARELLSRIEDAASGRVLVEACHAEVPGERFEQAHAAGSVLGEKLAGGFPFVDGAHALHADAAELVLNRTWQPAIEVTAAEGIPSLADGGSVLRPTTTLRLAMRIPPTCDADTAFAAVKAELERDPPHGAHVSFECEGAWAGWNAPPLEAWLETSLSKASEAHFGRPAIWMGEGGTIPFMSMLGEQFPKAQFVITGVLGPKSNAHGPNEFLHIPTAKKLTACVADVLEDHVRNR